MGQARAAGKSSLLVASALAGLLWDRFGASSTFYAGAAFCVLALLVLLQRPAARPLHRARLFLSRPQQPQTVGDDQ